jgi:hypothetical protein
MQSPLRCADNYESFLAESPYTFDYSFNCELCSEWSYGKYYLIGVKKYQFGRAETPSPVYISALLDYVKNLSDRGSFSGLGNVEYMCYAGTKDPANEELQDGILVGFMGDRKKSAFFACTSGMEISQIDIAKRSRCFCAYLLPNVTCAVPATAAGGSSQPLVLASSSEVKGGAGGSMARKSKGPHSDARSLLEGTVGTGGPGERQSKVVRFGDTSDGGGGSQALVLASSFGVKGGAGGPGRVASVAKDGAASGSVSLPFVDTSFDDIRYPIDVVRDSFIDNDPALEVKGECVLSVKDCIDLCNFQVFKPCPRAEAAPVEWYKKEFIEKDKDLNSWREDGVIDLPKTLIGRQKEILKKFISYFNDMITRKAFGSHSITTIILVIFDRKPSCIVSFFNPFSSKTGQRRYAFFAGDGQCNGIQQKSFAYLFGGEERPIRPLFYIPLHMLEKQEHPIFVPVANRSSRKE